MAARSRTSGRGPRSRTLRTPRARPLPRAFPRRDESRGHPVLRRRPIRVTAEEHALRVLDEHDYGRIGAREVLGAAARAASRCSGLRDDGASPAVRTEPVRAVPVQQRDEVGASPPSGWESTARVAQRGGLTALGALARSGLERSQGGERRVTTVETQEHQRVDVRRERAPTHPRWIARIEQDTTRACPERAARRLFETVT